MYVTPHFTEGNIVRCSFVTPNFANSTRVNAKFTEPHFTSAHFADRCVKNAPVHPSDGKENILRFTNNRTIKFVGRR